MCEVGYGRREEARLDHLRYHFAHLLFFGIFVVEYLDVVVGDS